VKIIAICGSARHRDAIRQTAALLREAGLVVLEPPLHRIGDLCDGGPGELAELAWKGATFAHFNRITKADAVLIVNPDGYAGTSTTLELGYAVARGKLVVAMAADRDEVARTVLFDLVLETADPAAAVAVLLATIKETDHA
jgi:nucleoside 2-deoxyribosyltransferase